jgi:hypothetical protein
MDVGRILSDIDAEISKLQAVRATLSGLSGTLSVISPARRRGRPKGSKNAVTVKPTAKKSKRNLSPEARKRIADAQKRRWAEIRKDQGKK